METVKNRLREIYVSALKLSIDPHQIADTNLTSTLGIDSISSLEILVWVEDEFNITVQDEDLSPALVDSLDTLSGYIMQRQGLAQAVRLS
jgi:acyl carrier protein